MAAAVPIVLNDGASTPVQHTFTPIGRDDKGVMWFEQTIPIPSNSIGAKRIGYRQVRGSSNSKTPGVGKVIFTVAMPSLETLGNNSAGILPPPTVAYRNVARIEFDLPERSTVAERKDLRVFVHGLFASASVMAPTLDNLLPAY